MEKREFLVYLNFLRLQNKTILKICDLAGEEKLTTSSLDFLDEKTRGIIFDKKNLDKYSAYKDDLERTDCQIVTIFDEDYPENLSYIDDRPAILYYKGRLSEMDKYSIAFVGARRCTDYGRRACKKLVEDIIAYDIPTVSGLAYGIDAVCHSTSLKNHKRTIGVIGCGIDQVYPKSNRRIFEEMAEEGLILSEFPLGTPPVSYNFPRRNRIISGLSLATVVVEAKEKSGTMITTNFALDQGREVFCVPGNINSIYSKGTNKLIQDGSKLVTKGEDILEDLLPLRQFLEVKEKEKLDLSGLDSDQARLVKYIDDNPSKGADAISEALGLGIDDVNYLLTSLELLNVIEDMGNGEFVIKR